MELVGQTPHHPRVDIILVPRLNHEFGHKAKVLSRAPQAPEEIAVLVFAGAEDLAAREDDFTGDQVVGDEAVGSAEESIAAASGQSADSGISDISTNGGEAVLLGRIVDVGPLGAAWDGEDSADGVDMNGAHGGEVDDYATGGGGCSSGGMAAAPDGEVDGFLRGVAEEKRDC